MQSETIPLSHRLRSLAKLTRGNRAGGLSPLGCLKLAIELEMAASAALRLENTSKALQAELLDEAALSPLVDPRQRELTASDRVFLPRVIPRTFFVGRDAQPGNDR